MTLTGLKYSILALLNPACWLPVHPYCPVWDARLRELMSKHKFQMKVWECGIKSSVTATLGPVEIWVENHPYASFVISDAGMPGRFVGRPSMATVLMANDKLKKDLLETL